MDVNNADPQCTDIFFYGKLEKSGHHLHDIKGDVRHFTTYPPGWNWPSMIDKELLVNKGIPEVADGTVYPFFILNNNYTHNRGVMFAFCWYDRSYNQHAETISILFISAKDMPKIDVNGMTVEVNQLVTLENVFDQAFEHALKFFPKVVARQKHPLVLKTDHYKTSGNNL